ncbi:MULTISPECIES: hypothetical protein [Mangrovimonas]|uniref:Uncharacterized protein n=1 Tax=Mangrovimonas cancribranchiae TaxID=3080055 RepID=A0AAU6NZR1_9FLAO|nr:hypothetical protein [Mangrovimonas spongiae]
MKAIITLTRDSINKYKPLPRQKLVESINSYHDALWTRHERYAH